MTQNTKTTEHAEQSPFIPYANLDKAPTTLKNRLDAYEARMGFIPNALKLHMHRPEIAEVLWALNDRVMRDPSSHLEPALKRQCALIASRINGCQYCTTHHCTIVKRPISGDNEGWGMAQKQIDALLDRSTRSHDEKSNVCFDFAAEASLDPANISDDVYNRLTTYLSPEEIVELALLVGFWRMYNTIHDSLKAPIEQELIEESKQIKL